MLISSIQQLKELVLILQNNPQKLFQGMEQVEYNLQIYKSNSIIFTQGQNNQNIYYLLSGQVSLYIAEERHHFDYRNLLIDKLTNNILKQKLIKSQQNPKKIIHKLENALISQIQKNFQLQVIDKQMNHSQDTRQISVLNPLAQFGECLSKKAFSAVAHTECLILELVYDEKYWKNFQQKITFLKNLQSINNSAIISSLMQIQTYKMGDCIFKEGEECNYFYIIEEGQVEMSTNFNVFQKQRPDSETEEEFVKQLKLCNLSSLSLFGLEEAFLNCRHVFSATCSSFKAQIYRIPIKGMHYLKVDKVIEQISQRLVIYQEIIKGTLRKNKTYKEFSGDRKSLTPNKLSSRPDDKIKYTHWLRNLSEVPRWNEQQMIREIGAEPNSKVIKSLNRKMPIFTFVEQPKRFCISSMLEANTDQYEELLKTYSKRLRSSKYTDLHQCLMGNWDRIFKPSETLIKSRQRRASRMKK